MNKALDKNELAKTKTELKEPIIVGFSNHQYAEIRLLEEHCILLTKFCDVNKFEEMEMDTDTLNLARAENELEGCIQTEMKAEWERLRSKTALIFPLLMQSKTFCECFVTRKKT